MKGLEIIKILTKAIPESESWVPEAYGAFNVDLNKNYNNILYCVTPTKEVVEYFKTNGFDLLISHHPFKVDIPQMIFHTALDCCKGGLNDMWKNAVGIKNAQHFDKNLGWFGDIDPINYFDLVKKVGAFCLSPPIGQLYYNGTEDCIVKSVVVCSGLGGMVTGSAEQTGADCYILGENVMPASETSFKAIIETGHTNSEWIGVKLFRKLLPLCIVELAPKSCDYFGSEVFVDYCKK